jgi:hypothetical protein
MLGHRAILATDASGAFRPPPLVRAQPKGTGGTDAHG